MADTPAEIVASIKGGKRVHGHTYIHTSLLSEQSKKVVNLVETAQRHAGITSNDYTVIRFSGLSPEIGLLNYPQFLEVSFPSLAIAYVVDTATKRVKKTDYSGRENPLILHRKELLLSETHPNRAQYETLTAALEKRGAFADNQRIGYRDSWQQRLHSLNIKIENGALVELPEGDAPVLTAPPVDLAEVARHRTAIVRDRLSAPMQALARHGLLTPERSVFDYGCGQGDDVRALQASGIRVAGWDPHFAPKTPQTRADIVNLGFVLNVIEDPNERVQAARKAFSLARQCLAIAVMVVGKGDITDARPYRDGFLTKRDTFQKYYRQDEIKSFLDSALGMEAIPVSPGIFFVFRDKILEQRFLLDRQRRVYFPIAPELRPPSERPDLEERRMDTIRPTVNRLWQQMLSWGRPLAEEEVPIDLMIEIKEKVGSLRRAERLGSSPENAEMLAAAATARREDLLVYFGLNSFNGRTRYSTLAPELQRDIKAFLGNATAANEAGKALLFSVGKPEIIDRASQLARQSGLGLLLEGDSLQLHSSMINRLPAALRCYVGCAAKLYGDVDTADLVKIHVRSGKLTLLFYDDFDSSPLPRMRERVKINMREQRIEYFKYIKDQDSQILYLKSRYMASDQPRYKQQKSFDDALVGLGLFDFSEYGPSEKAFNSILKDAGYLIEAFSVVRAVR